MEKNRLDKGIEIINYAIENGISVKAASVACGYSDTYVKNTKAKVFKAFEDGVLDEGDFNRFKIAVEIYDNYRMSSGVVTSTPNELIGNILSRLNNDNITNGNILSRLNNNNITKTPVSNEKTTVTGNDKVMDIEWKTTSYPDGHIKTVDELLAKACVDTDVWKVKDFVINKWDVTSFKNESPQTIENFQVKARLEKDQKAQNVKSTAEIFAEMCKNYKPPVLSNKERFPNNAENNLLEINIWDLHLGKLAWAGETGENYDTKIASQRFLYSIDMLLNRAENFNFSRILFPVGNDFFNSDTILNTTTHGTPQDEDLRWQKTFNVGVKLIIDGISILRSSGVPVDVLVIPGNHDFERSYYLGSYLEAWYHNDDMVNINNSASPRKYYNFGNVLLGFTHGNEEKVDSLPLLMATEDASKPMWSSTLFHEWHLGHIHRKRSIKYAVLDKNKILDEDLGVTVRYMSSLTGAEEWHHKKGFVGCTKAANAFIWNDKTGLVAELNSNYIIK